MGKDNMSKYGSFFVQMEKPDFAPGDQVNGMIYLNLLIDFPATHIELKLEGKEKVKYYVSVRKYDYTDQEGHEHYKTEYESRSDSHKCFKYKFPCATFNGGFVPMGQYQIPFQFFLPNDLPSTFYYKWYNHGECHAKIHYKAKATLESSDGNDLLKNKFDIVINAAPKKHISQKRVDINKEVVSWCCLNKGKFKMTSWFEKDAYMPGETAMLVVEAENNTSVECKSMKGNFTQEVIIKNGRARDKRILNMVEAPGLAPGEKYVGQEAKRIAIPLSGTRIKGGDDEGTSNTSVDGYLIDCNFYVSAQTEMDACICCDKHPKSEIYITLYNAIPTVSHQFQPPMNWAPKVMDPYVANLLPEFDIQVQQG